MKRSKSDWDRWIVKHGIVERSIQNPVDETPGLGRAMSYAIDRIAKIYDHDLVESDPKLVAEAFLNNKMPLTTGAEITDWQIAWLQTMIDARVERDKMLKEEASINDAGPANNK